MTIADEIISGKIPNLEAYLKEGDDLNDIDEYGFTPLIETAIAGNNEAMQLLLTQEIEVDKPDITGRSALHWAADNDNLEQITMLLEHGANSNAYNRGGQSVLVFPLLREQWKLKQLLYEYDSSLMFAQDFINAKLIGHRFDLKGDVDVVNGDGEFIEIDFEGFFLEFSLEIIRHSLTRFVSNYAFRSMRRYFPLLNEIINSLNVASQLLKYQSRPQEIARYDKEINDLLSTPLLILPIAYHGHAITFIRYKNLWAKIDRGENSLKEGSVNIYTINKSKKFNFEFLKNLLYKRQTKNYIHKHINKELGLLKRLQLPISPQTSGNCSWVNVEAIVPTAATMIEFDNNDAIELGMDVYDSWVEWDKDRSLEECIQSFYSSDSARKATKAAMLGAVLFQSLKYSDPLDLKRAEKILKIITLKDYKYVMQSYLEVYCSKRLTHKGNNLLQMLDDLGISPGVGVFPVAKTIDK